jgi:FAD/FMN-containing dehydrogenase
MKSEGSLGTLLGPGQTVTDWGRMQEATVRNVARPKTEGELQEIIRHAAKNKLKVSLRRRS